MKFSLKDRIKDKNMQVYILATITYLIGALADGLGFLNEGVNVIGMLILLAAMTFIISLLVIWYIYTRNHIKAFVINLLYLLVGIISALAVANLKMTSVVVTMCAFILANFIMLIYDMYSVGLYYYEELHKKRKNRNF